jgi:hypothetical protein
MSLKPELTTAPKALDKISSPKPRPVPDRPNVLVPLNDQKLTLLYIPEISKSPCIKSATDISKAVGS